MLTSKIRFEFKLISNHIFILLSSINILICMDKIVNVLLPTQLSVQLHVVNLQATYLTILFMQYILLQTYSSVQHLQHPI